MSTRGARVVSLRIAAAATTTFGAPTRDAKAVVFESRPRDGLADDPTDANMADEA
jgi:hypothetical protein